MKGETGKICEGDMREETCYFNPTQAESLWGASSLSEEHDDSFSNL